MLSSIKILQINDLLTRDLHLLLLRLNGKRTVEERENEGHYLA